MRPTEQLKEEHQAIKLALQILDGICRKLESDEEVDPKHLEQMLEFIRIFADRCHHGKEEDKLFPAMEEAGVPRSGGPIGVMLLEHDLGRNYVRAMEQAIVRYKASDRGAGSEIVENARNYIALLTQHIEKEDNILYPIADQRLSKEKEEELLEEFEIVEQERVGIGKHEEFHKLLEALKRIYLD